METLERSQHGTRRDSDPPPAGLPQRVSRPPARIAREWQRPGLAGFQRDQQIARGLGWFSIALGLTEMLAPRQLCRALGVEEHTALVRACGARELAAGIGILSQPQQPAWLWSRVAGDAMDLGLLAAAIARNGRDGRGGATVATLAVAGVTALDVYAANQMSRHLENAPERVRQDGSIRIERTLAVNRPPEDCYRMWRDFEQLPRFMQHLESVEVNGPRRSHWVARGPAGTRVEWDAEITEEKPDELLAWRSVEDADVENSGTVRFLRDGSGRGTYVDVSLQYKPPARGFGAAVAKLFGEEPEIQLAEDLRRFKRLIEAGELPTTDGQPHGSRPIWYRMTGGSQR